MRHGFDHFGASHEHIARIFDHEDEVGHGGGIHRATCRWAHDHRNLWNHARSHDIALEDFGVAAQGRHALLNARTTRVVQADNGRADFHGLVHDFADFLGVGFRQSATENREVLAEDKNQTTIDHAVARNHAVTWNFVVLHAEFDAAVLNKHIPFFKSAFVEQNFQAFAGGEFALFVLGINAALPATQSRSGALGFELLEDFFHERSFKSQVFLAKWG